MKCPHCGRPATLEHLRTSVECQSAIRSFVALYKLSKRTVVTRAGGRPATMIPCPRCGEQVSLTVARRGHGCTRQAGTAP